jgi:Family of unknown function (DUF6510)
MSMDEHELQLDGNAAAGLLAELLTVEATSALLTCAGCGATGAVATAQVYVHAPGTVLRCPACEGVLIRLARTPAGLHADFRGVRTLVVSSP